MFSSDSLKSLLHKGQLLFSCNHLVMHGVQKEWSHTVLLTPTFESISIKASKHMGHLKFESDTSAVGMLEIAESISVQP